MSQLFEPSSAASQMLHQQETESELEAVLEPGAPILAMGIPNGDLTTVPAHALFTQMFLYFDSFYCQV